MKKVKNFLMGNKISLILGVVIAIGLLIVDAKDYTPENNELKAEISKIEAEISEKDNQILKASAPSAELQAQIDTKKKELEKLSAENTNLSKEKKDLTDTYNTKVKEQKQNRLNALLGQVKINYDAVEKVAWVYYAGSSSYGNVNEMDMYLGVQNNRVWPRTRIRYTGETWLFIENYKIVTDSKEFNIFPTKVERDNDHRIWEWYDWSPSSSDLIMVKQIADSGSAIIRHNGQQYHDDRTITSEEKNGLNQILELYNLLAESSNIKVENGNISATIK